MSTDKLTPLLPCPLCCSDQLHTMDGDYEAKISCDKCGCMIRRHSNVEGRPINSCIKRWNTRQALSSLTPSDDLTLERATNHALRNLPPSERLAYSTEEMRLMFKLGTEWQARGQSHQVAPKELTHILSRAAFTCERTQERHDFPDLHDMIMAFLNVKRERDEALQAPKADDGMLECIRQMDEVLNDGHMHGSNLDDCGICNARLLAAKFLKRGEG